MSNEFFEQAQLNCAPRRLRLSPLSHLLSDFETLRSSLTVDSNRIYQHVIAITVSEYIPFYTQ
jgi:hypothetical protein